MVVVGAADGEIGRIRAISLSSHQAALGPVFGMAVLGVDGCGPKIAAGARIDFVVETEMIARSPDILAVDLDTNGLMDLLKGAGTAAEAFKRPAFGVVGFGPGVLIVIDLVGGQMMNAVGFRRGPSARIVDVIGPADEVPGPNRGGEPLIAGGHVEEHAVIVGVDI